MLENGLDVSKTIEKLKSDRNGWSAIPTSTITHEIPQLGVVAWNFKPPAAPIAGNDQKKSGVLISISDANPERGFNKATVVVEALGEIPAVGTDLG